MGKALDIALASVLLALAVLPAWFFGGIQSATQCWLFLGMLTATAVYAARVALTRTSVIWPWLLLPLVIGLVLAALQMVPMRSAWLAVLSPRAHQWWTELGTWPEFAVWDQVEPPREDGYPVSLYPASSQRDWTLLALLTATVLLAANGLRTRRLRLLTMAAAAVNGAALAIFGILQQLTWNGQLYWTVPLTQGGEPFASFVNRNHAAGYLNLCLAGAIGMVVWALARHTYSRDAEYEAAICEQVRAVRKRRLFDTFRGSFDQLSLAALALAAVITAGVLFSLSRGGILALGIAALVTSLAATRTRLARTIVGPTVAIAVLGLCLALWLGRGDLLRERLAASLSESVDTATGRLAHWRDASQAAKDFWITGSGLGTYRYVYRPYESSYVAGWYYHAENQYLEALVELGVAGVVLIVSALGLAVYNCWQLLRDEHSATNLAVGIAALFALTAQAVQAIFDFGLYMPANAVMFAVICGLASTGHSSPAAQPGARGTWRLLMLATLMAVEVAMVSGLRVARHYRSQEAAVASFDDWDGRQPVTHSTLAGQLASWRALVSHRPHDAGAQLKLAKLYELEYRALILEALQREAGGAADPEILWQLSSAAQLHRRIHELDQAGDDPRHAALRKQPAVDRQLRASAGHLREACRSCPLIPEAHLGLAQLCVAFDQPECEVRHLRHAVALSPFDPDNLFRAGLLHLQAGRQAAGFALWQACLETSSRYDEQILTAGQQLATSAVVVSQLLPASPARLIELARRWFDRGSATDMRLRIAAKLANFVAESAASPAEEKYLTAVAAELGGLEDAALTSYEQAVALRPDVAAWRYDWANALARSGDWRGALVQARMCVRLRPQSPKYRDLVRRSEQAIRRSATPR